MSAKTLLLVTAGLEIGTGVVLAIWPSGLAALLFGSPLSTPVGVTVGRLTGAALCSLGAACWLARRDESSRAAVLIRAMLLYNGAAVAVLLHAGMVLGLLGVALGPAVLLHTMLGAWCIACLRRTR
jgi:hypothetical protein